MSLSINTNAGALVAANAALNAQKQMEEAMTRLSTGKRVNTAKDDPGSLSIAIRMTAEVNGLEVALKNAQDAQSVIDTGEAALNEVHTLLLRMRELAVQSASGVASGTDRDYLDLEMTNLVSEIDAIAANTKFNDQRVLTGASFTFYTDIDVAGTAITTSRASVAAVNLAVTVAAVDISSATSNTSTTGVQAVITRIDNALGVVDNRRAALGAVSNRFDHIIDNLQNVIMNTVSSQSRIVDADFSIETTVLTRNTVLQQAATSMLAQANAQKNSILSLIQQ